MAADLFMRVEEVAEVMGVSVSYAYKIIRQFNKELKKTGSLLIDKGFQHSSVKQLKCIAASKFQFA